MTFSKVVCTVKVGLVLAFLLFSNKSFSQMPMLSVGVAGTSIGSDKGVSLQFRSPLVFNSIEKMRGFGLHLNLNQMKAFSYDFGYTLISAGASILLHEIHAFRFFFTSSGNYFVGGSEVSGAGGLLYTLTSEWELTKKWSLNLEAGYSLSFASINVDPRPYKVDFQKIANGFSFILGRNFTFKDLKKVCRKGRGTIPDRGILFFRRGSSFSIQPWRLLYSYPG